MVGPVAPRHHKSILPTRNLVAANDGMAASPEVDSCTVLQPFIGLIFMIAHPVRNVFFSLRAVQTLPVIVTEVAVFNPEAIHITGHECHPVAGCRKIFEGDIFSAVSKNRNTIKFVGCIIVLAAFQNRMININGDVIALDHQNRSA